MMKQLRPILCILLSCSLLGCSSITTSKNKSNVTAANYNVQLGLGYLGENNTSRAKQKLLLALNQAPNWSVALDAMAYYLEVTGDKQNAALYYQKALKASPNSGAALNNYGTFLCRTGRFQDAEQYFLKAGNTIDYLNSAEAYENAGLCELGVPNQALAEKYLLKALEQDPNRTAALWELSKINFHRGDVKTAYRYIVRYNQLALPDAKKSLARNQDRA